MGNSPRPHKPWHDTPTRSIGQPEGDEGGGGVAVDTAPVLTWKVTLEDLTAAAQNLRPDVAVRGVWSEPRFGIYAGEDLVGFVPARKSAEIRQAMELYGGTLQGWVRSVSERKVVVVLSLEGR